MIQIYAILAALILAVGGFAAYQTKRIEVQQRDIRNLKSQVFAVERGRKEAVKAAVSRKAGAEKAKASEKAAKEALDKALQGPAESWGATQVPQEVLDAL
jgi:uncharacterized protein HemX